MRSGPSLRRSGRRTRCRSTHGLRKAVGAERISLRGAGYSIAVEGDELDLHRFERLVAQWSRARSSTAAGTTRSVRTSNAASSSRGASTIPRRSCSRPSTGASLPSPRASSPVCGRSSRPRCGSAPSWVSRRGRAGAGGLCPAARRRRRRALRRGMRRSVPSAERVERLRREAGRLAALDRAAGNGAALDAATG